MLNHLSVKATWLVEIRQDSGANAKCIWPTSGVCFYTFKVNWKNIFMYSKMIIFSLTLLDENKLWN